MSWEYRVVEKESDGEKSFHIHEVYYNDSNVIDGWTQDSIAPMGVDNLDDLKGDLELMGRATELKPIKEDDLKAGVHRKETV